MKKFRIFFLGVGAAALLALLVSAGTQQRVTVTTTEFWRRALTNETYAEFLDFATGSNPLTNLIPIGPNMALYSDSGSVLSGAAFGGSNTVLIGETPMRFGGVPDGALSANVPILGFTNRFDTLKITNGFSATIHTFPSASNALDMAIFRWKYTAVGNMDITNLYNYGAGGEDYSSMLSVTNPWSTNVTVYVSCPGITTDDGLRSYVVTNQSQRKFSFNHDDDGSHLVSRPFF